MDIINEMKKTRSYKKHVKLLNELIQFTSKSKKNEKLILKVADLHLVLAKSIQICSKGMKMEGGGLLAALFEKRPPTDHDNNKYTEKELNKLIKAHEVKENKIPDITPQQVAEYSYYNADDRPSTDGDRNGFLQKLKEFKKRLFGDSTVAPAPLSFDNIGEMTEMPHGIDTGGRPVFVPGAPIIPQGGPFNQKNYDSRYNDGREIPSIKE
jgi:hypothetical protein